MTQVGQIGTIGWICEGLGKGMTMIKMHCMRFSKTNKSENKDKHTYTKNENTTLE